MLDSLFRKGAIPTAEQGASGLQLESLQKAVGSSQNLLDLHDLQSLPVEPGYVARASVVAVKELHVLARDYDKEMSLRGSGGTDGFVCLLKANKPRQTHRVTSGTDGFVCLLKAYIL